LNPRQRPRPIIDYAKQSRQAVLKYLAILRWKTTVDTPLTSLQGTLANGQNGNQATSFPTPHSNGDSNDTSPGTYVGKGKGKMVDEDIKPVTRGKVTDAKRITHFMEHQNRQHEESVTHLRHTAKIVNGLR
jgi:mediator of RNA polymerase II transcription subunit 14